jgi:hypothetical protein
MRAGAVSIALTLATATLADLIAAGEPDRLNCRSKGAQTCSTKKLCLTA